MGPSLLSMADKLPTRPPTQYTNPSVCPFMVYGEWAQETLKKVIPATKLRKWPQSITNG